MEVNEDFGTGFCNDASPSEVICHRFTSKMSRSVSPNTLIAKTNDIRLIPTASTKCGATNK